MTFSPARQFIIRSLYPAGWDTKLILEEVNKTPGQSITLRQLQHWTSDNGVLRPPKEGNFSAERQEIVRRRYAAGDPMSVIVAEVNALPGPTIGDKQVHNWCADHGVKRPTDHQKLAPSIFTKARQEIIRRLYPTEASNDQILDEVNRCEGPRVNLRQLQNWCHRKGVLRSSAFISQAVSAAARQIEREPRSRREPKVYAPISRSAPPPKLASTDRKVAVERRVIYMWGARLGLPLKHRGDVEAVSRAYRELEDPAHPGFRIKESSINPSLFRDRS